MAGSAVGDNTAGLLGAFHDKRILEVLQNTVTMYQLASKRPIVETNGNQITFHTVTKLADGSSLTEGVQPNANFMTGGTKTATLQQKGDIVKIADVMAKSAVQNMIDIAVEQMGAAAGRTVDHYIQDQLLVSDASDLADGSIAISATVTTTAATAYADTIPLVFLSANAAKTTGANFNTLVSAGLAVGDADKLNLKKLRKIVTELESANVPTYDGSNYAMVCHPVAVKQLREDPEWREWNRYNDADKMFKGEVGVVEQCRVIKSTNLYKAHGTVAKGIPAAISAYISYIFGKECFTVTEFAGDTGIKTYVLGFDTKDTANVLQQNAHVGYKWTGVAKVLDGQQGFGIVSLEK